MITRNQRRAYEFIRGYIASNEEAPTLREIGTHIGMSSSASVYYLLQNLEDRGYIRRSRQHRGIELIPREIPNGNELMIGGREG